MTAMMEEGTSELVQSNNDIRRISKDMSNLASSVSFSLLSNTGEVRKLFSATLQSNGTYWVGGTDENHNWTWVDKYDAGWTHVSRTLLRYHDYTCWGNCLRATGAYGLQVNAAGKVYGWVEEHPNDNFFVYEVTP